MVRVPALYIKHPRCLRRCISSYSGYKSVTMKRKNFPAFLGDHLHNIQPTYLLRGRREIYFVVVLLIASGSVSLPYELVGRLLLFFSLYCTLHFSWYRLTVPPIISRKPSDISDDCICSTFFTGADRCYLPMKRGISKIHLCHP